MNYQKIYVQIIERAKRENRTKNREVYYEKHHIIPRCLGGSNSKDNLAYLTAKEHYIAHRLLVEIQTIGSREYYQMLNAFSFFAAKSKKHKRVEVSARYYQKVKTVLADKRRGIPRTEEVKARIRKTKAENPRIMTEEEKLFHSKRMIGKGNPMYGKTHSKEVRETLRKLKLGKKNPKLSEINKAKKGKELSYTKKVSQWDLQGNKIAEYISISEARRMTGVGSIICVLRGIQKTAGGFIWEYVK